MNKTQITIEDMDGYFQRGRANITIPVKALSEDLLQRLMALGAEQPLFKKMGFEFYVSPDESVIIPEGLMQEYRSNSNMELISVEKETFYTMKLSMELSTKNSTEKRAKI